MSVQVRQTQKGRVYDVRLRGPDGRVVTRTFKTKRDASAYEATQRTAKSAGTWVDPAGRARRFGEVAAEWLASNPAKRDSSRSRDDSALRVHILPLLEDHKIGAIKPADVRAAVARWTSTLSPKSVHRVYGVLRAVMNFAVDSDWLGRTPCRNIKLPAIAKRKRVRVPPEAVVAIAAATGPRYEAMVWTGVETGLRWGEVAGLRVCDVDFLGRRLGVRQQVARGPGGRPIITPPKSEAGDRDVAISPDLVEVLSAHMAARGLTAADEEALIFPNGTGGPLSYSTWRRRVWVPAVIAAGYYYVEASDTARPGETIKKPTLGFHDLRRENATIMVRAKVDVKTGQKRLGHSDPRLTLAIYADATDEGDEEAAEVLAARFLRTRPDGHGRAINAR